MLINVSKNGSFRYWLQTSPKRTAKEISTTSVSLEDATKNVWFRLAGSNKGHLINQAKQEYYLELIDNTSLEQLKAIDDYRKASRGY